MPESPDESDYATLSDEQRDDVISWCHRWACSQLADDYCGCSPDHLDRDMADRLIESVIEPLFRENLAHVIGVLGSLNHYANALEQMSRNLRSVLPPQEDDEEFCPRCLAGTESSEHHEKCEADDDE